MLSLFWPKNNLDKQKSYSTSLPRQGFDGQGLRLTRTLTYSFSGSYCQSPDSCWHCTHKPAAGQAVGHGHVVTVRTHSCAQICSQLQRSPRPLTGDILHFQSYLASFKSHLPEDAVPGIRGRMLGAHKPRHHFLGDGTYSQLRTRKDSWVCQLLA